MIGALLSILVAAGAPGGAPVVDAESMASVLEARLVYASTRHRPRPLYVRHCRKAPEGCPMRIATFSRYFVEASRIHDIDPWLVAAMAVAESGLNPFARGPNGELGLLQIHPRNKRARRLRFARDAKYRNRCRDVVGACQRELVVELVGELARVVEHCGGLEAGLGAYNTGRCDPDVGYVRKVLRIRKKLAATGGSA
jgi:hypothetical protein